MEVVGVRPKSKSSPASSGRAGSPNRRTTAALNHSSHQGGGRSVGVGAKTQQHGGVTTTNRSDNDVNSSNPFRSPKPMAPKGSDQDRSPHQSQQHRRQQHQQLKTPPIPDDLPRFRDDGRFASNTLMTTPGTVFSAANPTSPLTLRDDETATEYSGGGARREDRHQKQQQEDLYPATYYAKHRMDGKQPKNKWLEAMEDPTGTELFPTIEQNDHEVKKAVIRCAMNLLRSSQPHIPAARSVTVVAQVADRFLRCQNRYGSTRLPLRDADVATVASILAQEIAGLAPELTERLAPPVLNVGGGGGSGSSPFPSTARRTPTLGAGFGSITPPGVLASSSANGAKGDLYSSQNGRPLENEAQAVFDEVTATFRTRLIRFLSLYDPGRLRDVDKMLDDADNKGYAGAEEDLMKELVRTYGPEPPSPELMAMSSANGGAGGPSQPLRSTVAISDPIARDDGSVIIYCSVQRTDREVPQWSMASGNTVANTPIGLDALANLGVARTSIVIESPPLPHSGGLRFGTLALELFPGAIRPGAQYTVFMSLMGSGATATRARDHKTFFVEWSLPEEEAEKRRLQQHQTTQ